MSNGRAWGWTVPLWMAAAVATALVQVALVPWLRVGDATPDMAVATTVAVALHFGPWAGVGWAALVGILVDVLAAHPVGLLALPLVATGYLAGLGHRVVLESRMVAPFVGGLLGTLVYVILQVPLARLWGYAAPWTLIAQGLTLTSAGYTGIMTWGLFLALLQVHRLQRQDHLRIRWMD